MVKLRKSGVAYQTLYERDPAGKEPDITLAEVISSLGLKPLTAKEERKVRHGLGFAVGKYEAPNATFEVADVISSLRALAKALESFSPLLAIAKGGHLRGRNLARDMEVCAQLAGNVQDELQLADLSAAYAIIVDFGDRAVTVASAARKAADRLKRIRGTGGGTPHLWYDEFAAVLVNLCRENGIEPTVGFDTGSDKPVGGLATIAARFERLLPPWTRSPTPEAMVKRLQRSLERLARKA